MIKLPAFDDVLVVLGLIATGVGCGLIYLPAGLIVTGALLFLIGIRGK